MHIETTLAKRCGEQASLPSIAPEFPDDASHGDLAFPVFSFARILKQSPREIAQGVVDALDAAALGITKMVVVGGYINVFLEQQPVVEQVLRMIDQQQDAYGNNTQCAGQNIVVEFSSPNTNKPLHLGHLRNNAIGESVSRILRASGAAVTQLCLFNDRGVHICKSMVAYGFLEAGSSPASQNTRGDQFVGDLYVQFAQRAKEDPSLEERAQELLRRWESEDPEVRSLWKTMRTWVVEGILSTYKRCGIHFDAFEYESEIYMRGRAIVLEGLERGIFYREADGSICVNLESWGLDTKILLRSDGTALYITQDLGAAIRRVETYDCDHMVYVVANEQEYHFSVLFKILELLGHAWAGSCRHLSYGMVHIPEGRMKSREGTVVDAEDLIDNLRELVRASMEEKHTGQDKPANIAESVALGALHYYLLWPNPSTEIAFDTKKSLSFSGNTGPYIQYTCTRIHSIERRAKKMQIDAVFDPALLQQDGEWQLVKVLARFAPVVGQAAVQENPSLIAHYAYDLAKLFTMYYHETPILGEDMYAPTRLFFARCIGRVLGNCLRLLVIPSVEEM